MNRSIVLVIVFLVVGCDSRDQVYDGDPIETLVTGTWDMPKSESYCKSQFHNFKFSNDKSRMNMMFYDSESKLKTSVEYIIESSENGILHTNMVGEDRKDNQGNLVKWKLILNNEYQYCWRRSDWGESSCTTAFKRCN